MGIHDIKTEIKFGATIAIPTEHIKQAKTHELLQYKKDSVARDLGMKIADEKGWVDEHESGDLTIAEMRLYVFTPAELMDFMDAKFKAKLRHMAATEEYLTDREREVLMIQSERF